MQTTAKVVHSRNAFELLMRNAFSTETLPMGRTLLLEAHPFGLEVKSPDPDLNRILRRIYYVGEPGISDSVLAMVRIVAQYLAALGPGGPEGVPLVWHLRRILCGNDADGRDIYYELAVADTLFICGGCTDGGGAGGWARNVMDGVFKLLRKMYHLHIDNHFYHGDPHPQRLVLEEILALGGTKASADPPPKDLHHFNPGREVRMSEFARRMRMYPPGCKEGDEARTFTVVRVESTPYRCSCGMGERVHLELHPLRCGLNVRRNQMHHQILTLWIEGKTQRISGVFFEPAE